MQVEYPSAAIYRGFLSVAEADGRKIVASDDAAQTLSVSYPFSWTTWGGEISVHCVADGQGARVLFEHGKHDAAYKVKKIETKMFEDTLDWLRQSAGRAYLEALKDERAQQH